MCGIAGILGRGDADVLHRMAMRLAHRGPDGDGFLIDPAAGVHLAHRRLAVLDLAGGHQPMHSADRALSVVFNGEIYNFTELRRELEAAGARFSTDHSDTEVLLHGWRAWGSALPQRLNGMWAFALLDRERRCVFFSRDRLGKKPLYYHAGVDFFAFASELGALREHPQVPTAPSETALRKYFAYGYVPAPLSYVEGVRKLPGGHNLTLSLDTLEFRVERYWEYRPEPAPSRNADAAAEELRATLEAAVARRLVADVPVGCFLSGGVDSSTVAALALRRTGRERLRTFSIGFDEASFDESVHACRVADHIGADHCLGTVRAQDALDALPMLASNLDEPIADSSILPTYLLCGHARREVTVTLGGDGADELFAGYDPFRALRYARWYARLVPRPLHHAIALATARLPVSHRYMSLDFRVKRTLRGLGHAPRLWLPLWMAPLAPDELEQLFRAPIDPEDLYSEAIAAWDNCPSADPVERTIAFYIKLYLQDDILAKVDRASMLHSLEVRTPFLDINVVDFARRLPTALKLRGGETKWILKRVAETLLPREIVHRTKQGFAMPVGRWLAEGQLPGRSPQWPLNAAFCEAKLAEHRRGEADQRLFLWGATLAAHNAARH